MFDHARAAVDAALAAGATYADARYVEARDEQIEVLNGRVEQLDRGEAAGGGGDAGGEGDSPRSRLAGGLGYPQVVRLLAGSPYPPAHCRDGRRFRCHR